MPQPSRIVEHELERTVLRQREKGATVDAITAACNLALKRRKRPKGQKAPSVSKASVERYLAALDKDAVAIAHRPQEAERGHALAMNFSEQWSGLNEKLMRWIEEADGAHRIHAEAVGKGENRRVIEIDLGPDWAARTSVARELHTHFKLYTDLMERIYNAEQIETFQRAVMAEIEAAAPEVAAAIRDRLRTAQSVRKAALLGEVA